MFCSNSAKLEQEIGYVSPFHKFSAIHTLTQRYFWKIKTSFQHKVTEMQQNCLNIIYIGLLKNKVYMLRPSLLLAAILGRLIREEDLIEKGSIIELLLCTISF